MIFLFSNWLWSEKFGLFNVDFSSPDLPRTAKASARYLAQIIRDNGFRTNQPCNNYPISKWIEKFYVYYYFLKNNKILLLNTIRSTGIGFLKGWDYMKFSLLILNIDRLYILMKGRRLCLLLLHSAVRWNYSRDH